MASQQHELEGAVQMSPLTSKLAEQHLTSRAYQLEMFEQSLKQNIIVCMETGSGKTHVARLRIEHELARQPSKLIWFLAPSQVLARQQHAVLTAQLPMYSFRLITGADNVRYWYSQAVWDAALLNQNGVVSTPQVLLDALASAYVLLSKISLLILDEAHHCIEKNPYNQVMGRYHETGKTDPSVLLPSILGLTASPMIRDDLSLISELEANTDALCRSPTINIGEYNSFTNLSELVLLPFAGTSPSTSFYVPLLADLIRTYDVEKDPTIAKLRQSTSVKGAEKLQKYLEKQEPPILYELKDLLKKSAHIEDSLGSWAADRYVLSCIDKLLQSVQRKQDCLFVIEHDEQIALAALVRPLRDKFLSHNQQPIDAQTVSPQALELIRYLQQEYRDGMACVVFVQRRSSAYALCEILGSSKLLGAYRCFSFVGSSDPSTSHLTDLAIYGQQDRAFADFRSGKTNICVATSVLEEGIDVQACNLVVCFDLPVTNRSYIQRRGRARHQSAKFVIMHPDSMAPKILNKWARLEEEMKRLYSENERTRQDLLAREVSLNDSEEDEPLRHGHAMVKQSAARQKLEFFCATLRRYGESAQSPVFILDRSCPGLIGCTVLLPPTAPPDVRNARSSRLRRTEMAAKQDAALQAYKRLYEAGLLNDHLMPIHAEARRPRGARFPAIESRASIVEVAAAIKPWDATRTALSQGIRLHPSQITVPGLPSMLALLPCPLPWKVSCELHTISSGLLAAKVTPTLRDDEFPQSLSAAISKFLFRYVLGRKLPGIEQDTYALPYYLVPDLAVEKLGEWLRTSQQSAPLDKFNFRGSVNEYLINKKGEPMPYFFFADGGFRGSAEPIEAVRLSRTLDYTIKVKGRKAEPERRSLEQTDCTISLLEAGYAKLMAFVPTIMHTVESALRTQQAQLGPLRSLAYRDGNKLTAALTVARAGALNYQRLEYLGDVVLKLMATINLFCNNPNLPEGALSIGLDRIVNNARLHRSALDIGLDAYINAERFSGSTWTLSPTTSKAKRALSSKTLADVIEALLGAAYVEFSATNLLQVLQALRLFLPEIDWQPPAVDVAKVNAVILPHDHSKERLDHVQDMLLYQFRQPGLLAEALHHSSTHSTPLRSYDRLEFLGDAILDFLVKRPLYNSPRELSEGYMTLARHALVEKDTFAFLATMAVSEIKEQAIHVDPRTGVVQTEEKVRVRYLHDYMTRVPSQELSSQRSDLLKRFKAVRERVSQAMETGKAWPWADLLSLASPKWASDVLESIVGAVFVDSRGDLAVCEAVVRKLGLMQIVERVAMDGGIQFQQARSKVRDRWARIKFRSARYRRGDDEAGQAASLPQLQGGHVTKNGEEAEGNQIDTNEWLWRCQCLRDGVVIGEVEGANCIAEAEERAAEVALATAKDPVGIQSLSGDSGESLAGMKRDRGDEEEEDDDDDRIGNMISRGAEDAKDEGELAEDIIMIG